MSVRSAGTSGSRPSTRTSPRLGGSAVASRIRCTVIRDGTGPGQPLVDLGCQVLGFDSQHDQTGRTMTHAWRP